MLPLLLLKLCLGLTAHIVIAILPKRISSTTNHRSSLASHRKQLLILKVKGV
jgi:hypothetical protein